MTMDEVRTLLRRDLLGGFLNDHGMRHGIGLEVGTYKGDFAAQLASSWDCLTLHTCDPWCHYPEYTDGCVLDWGNNKAPADLEKYREEAMAKLAPLKNVQVHRTTGINCLNGFQDGGLSMCYLDGNHGYEAVLPEMRLGWQKVERGGLLGGHDVYERSDSEQICGVWRALWEFSHEVGIRPHITHCTSWWFAKP